jgi:hypothetical protein
MANFAYVEGQDQACSSEAGEDFRRLFKRLEIGLRDTMVGSYRRSYDKVESEW